MVTKKAIAPKSFKHQERSLSTPTEVRYISMIEPRSMCDLIAAPILAIPEGKRPVRILDCGVLQDVNSVIHQLHVVNFAEVIAWTPPVPSPVRGEVIRILTRQVNIRG